VQTLVASFIFRKAKNANKSLCPSPIIPTACETLQKSMDIRQHPVRVWADVHLFCDAFLDMYGGIC
jgi:hypothetical protein